jgi:hypothetical protein
MKQDDDEVVGLMVEETPIPILQINTTWYDETTPPPPPPPPPLTETPHITGETTTLEDRVQELELKLSTLSLLLQQQRRHNNVRSISPSPSPPDSPTPPEESSNNRATPALDSPAPHCRPRLKRTRNLSFRLLYQDASGILDPDSSTIYLPPDLNSDEPQLAQANQQADVPDPLEVSEAWSNTKSAEKPVSDGRSKWLDYLNSFQESTHDVDQQMEEFIKVPSAVEALLSYGFWICVDSFLYVVTILPIRFVWSTLLLIRYVLYRIWKRDAPQEGPYRFHRR